MRQRWAEHRQIVERLAAEAREKPLRHLGAKASQTAMEADLGDGSMGPLGLVQTVRKGHAADIVAKLIDEIEGEALEERDEVAPLPFHLIVMASGDGTSLEALETLVGARAQVLARLAVLRLPMGTGNDGADDKDMAKALSLLVDPVKVTRQKAVVLRSATPGKGPFHAFNILSLGLDAFVTHMTNKMKIAMPGDSYKLWVDVAALFYDLFYPLANMRVRAFDAKGKSVLAFDDKLLLIAMGESGHRSYGSSKPILPTDDNVCAVSNIPVLKRIALKALFTTGRHADRPEARIFSADRLEINADRKILAQMDGEAVELLPEDFPVTLALSEPIIPILKKM